MIKDEWRDFVAHDQPTEILFQNLMQTPDFYFSYIFDGKTFIFEAPVCTEFDVEFGVEMSDSADENMMPDSGVLVLYDLKSAQDEAVRECLTCPIDLGYELFVYYYNISGCIIII